MTDEERKKRRAEKVGTWDKFITGITPGPVHERAAKLDAIADANEAEERRKAELEAVRQKRMNAGR